MEYAQLNPNDTNLQNQPEVKNAKAKLDEAMNTVTDKSREYARYADEQVQQNPWTAVGVGFGVGVLFGALITLAAYSQRVSFKNPL